MRVSPEGNDTNDGSSWASAKRTVQAAIDAASTSGGDVWVKTGTYLERITLQSCVHVYGGFAGAETERQQRNWRAHVSILDGRPKGAVVTARYLGHFVSTIDGFTIRNGAALPGGGIYCDESSLLIANNTITGNNSNGIDCYNSSCPAIVNNVITANAAAGISCNSSSSPVITNNTIVGQNPRSGIGIACYGTSPTITNTIIAFNSYGIKNGGGAPSLQSNCLYGNTRSNYSGMADATGTNGNISANPLFVRTPDAGTDGQWATADDDYGDLHLKAGSPCIDAGDNGAVPAGVLTDLDGHFRFFDDPATADTGLGTAPIVDMGAYEYIPGDFDRDGDIDADDMKAFGVCVSGPAVPYSGDCTGADFDKDGDVDQSDFGFIQRCFSGAGKGVDPNCAS